MQPTVDDGYALKLRRAHYHLDDLNCAITAWFNGDHHAVRVEQDCNGVYQFILRVDDLPLEPFSLLIGDILHNLRSSLDQLAFALLTAYTQPVPDNLAGDSEFPIFGDLDRRKKPGAGSGMFRAAKRKIEGIHPSAKTVIEGLQPYHRGNLFVDDPLWRLHDLSRIDKHRLIHPSVVISSSIKLDIDRLRRGNIREFGSPFRTFDADFMAKNEAVIASSGVMVPADSSKKMHMDIEPVLGIGFRQGTPTPRQNVLDVLTAIYNHIVTNVVPQLTPYL